MSIHPHSSHNQYFIYCVGQSPYQIAAFKAAMATSCVGAKALIGRYHGKYEQSFISNMKHFDLIHPWLSGEESILVIHSFNARDEPKATLHYLSDHRREYLGRMIAVDPDYALSQPAYTYDPLYNNYFICRPEGYPRSAARGRYVPTRAEV